MSTSVNDNLVMICGEPIAGKSASLRNLKVPEGVAYMNCEAGKKLPFSAKFMQSTVTDPWQIPQAFEWAETQAHIHTLVVDSLTFMMDMFISRYIMGAKDTMKGWANYGEFFRNLMQQNVAASTKNVIFTAHVERLLNEQTSELEKRVPISGKLGKNGVEAFFSTIVTAKTVTLEKLSKYENDLLTITEDDELLGYKHVFQTRLTKDTIGERGMRSPMGMWDTKETYINNDAQLLLDRLNQFYA